MMEYNIKIEFTTPKGANVKRNMIADGIVEKEKRLEIKTLISKHNRK